MSEFYLHSLSLTDLNVWDPNTKLGDLKLMALASWMNHEEARATEMNKVMAIEETKPLMTRAKLSNPMVVINTHNLIENDPRLAPRYLATQDHEVTHFEDMFMLLEYDHIQALPKKMEHLALQPENQRIPFSSENERYTKHNTHVQGSSTKNQSQLDWLQTQSTTAFRNVGRKESRRRNKVVGRDGEQGRILFTRRRNYSRSMGCQGG